METKKFNSVATVPNMGADQYVILTDGSGNTTKISLASLKKSLLEKIDLNMISDGAFIMYHGKSDDYPRMVKPEAWPSLQSGGTVAEGVVIVEGGKILVVAPTESSESLLWSSEAIAAGGKTTSDRETALYDWTGRDSTTAQISHAECNTETYAPGYCANYSRVNSNGKGLTAGKWWLPSLGELMCIYANKRKINYALGFIQGATPLSDSWYWSSTESSAANAWTLYLSGGLAGNTTKASYYGHVRAVSAFYH